MRVRAVGAHARRHLGIRRGARRETPLLLDTRLLLEEVHVECALTQRALARVACDGGGAPIGAPSQVRLDLDGCPDRLGGLLFEQPLEPARVAHRNRLVAPRKGLQQPCGRLLLRLLVGRPGDTLECAVIKAELAVHEHLHLLRDLDQMLGRRHRVRGRELVHLRLLPEHALRSREPLEPERVVRRLLQSNSAVVEAAVVAMWQIDALFLVAAILEDVRLRKVRRVRALGRGARDGALDGVARRPEPLCGKRGRRLVERAESRQQVEAVLAAVGMPPLGILAKPTH